MNTTEENKIDLIKKIKRLEFKVHQIVESTLSGNHNSLFKGQGMEFDEFREYISGDEIKNIDWNVTARMNTPYIKRYQEERELIFNLIVDNSASNQFGSTEPTKRQMINEITAALTFSIIKNKDKVGFLSFSDQIEEYLPPKKGITHGFKIISECLFNPPQSKRTNLSETLQFFLSIQKKKSTVFILSDFLFSNNIQEYHKWLQLLALKHNVYVLQTLDPLELELKKMGLINLRDSETGRQVVIDTNSKRIRNQFNQHIQEHQKSLKKLFYQYKIHYLPLSSDRDYFSEISSFLRKKRR